jgi:MoaA/NifB/PqqE/SkfB family radical SAM enzyme
MNLAETVTEKHPHRSGMFWLEVTNGCNLNCSHCYSDSFPGSQSRDKLSHSDYLRIVDEAADLGMSTIQFIGGEPLLYKRLPELIQRAQARDFEFIEIFSNLTADRPDVFSAADPVRTSFATSVYSDDPAVHDLVVKRAGSFSQTIGNVRKLVLRGIDIRAGFIEMELNRGHYQRTVEFLRKIGVAAVGFDEVREFGRGGEQTEPCMSQLCGACAGNTLCVTYEGEALPCIMSRSWPVGNIFKDSLRAIMDHGGTAQVRSQIAEAGKAKAAVADWCPPSDQCFPSGCPPYQGCDPCGPNCPPNRNCRPHQGYGQATTDFTGNEIRTDSCDPFKPVCPPARCAPGRPLPPCNPTGYCSPPCAPNQTPCHPTDGRCNPR